MPVGVLAPERVSSPRRVHERLAARSCTCNCSCNCMCKCRVTRAGKGDATSRSSARSGMHDSNSDLALMPARALAPGAAVWHQLLCQWPLTVRRAFIILLHMARNCNLGRNSGTRSQFACQWHASAPRGSGSRKQGITRSYSTPACELSPGLWRAVAVFSLKISPARACARRRSVAPALRVLPCGALRTTAYHFQALAVGYDFL